MALSPMSDVDMNMGISILRNALIAVLEQVRVVYVAVREWIMSLGLELEDQRFFVTSRACERAAQQLE